MEILITLVAMLFCLVAEGFFSGSEIGVVSADQMKLRHAAAKGSKGARLALKMLEKPEWLLSTTLVGTNISVVANTTMATALMIELFGEGASWLAIVLVAPLIWVFGEIVPKSVFQQRADTLTPRAIFPLRFASYVFFPILIVFTFLTRLFTKLFGGARLNPFTLREEIITMIQMPAQDGDLEPTEKTMIRRMFNFSETTVEQIMVPLIDVHAIDESSNCGQAMRSSVQSAHVRLPAFDGRIDRIVGVLHTMELLGMAPDEPIKAHIRPVRYVPGSKSIKDLMVELRQEGDALAVVVDEFGGAQGIATIEDIMEEVVEDIEDEYDSNEPSSQWIRKLGKREYLVSARIELTKLTEQLGVQLPTGDNTTLAGFLLDLAHEVPPAGSVIKANGLSFIIERGTPQAIQEVRVRW